MNNVEWDLNTVHTCSECGGLMGENIDGDTICHCGNTVSVKSLQEKRERALVGDILNGDFSYKVNCTKGDNKIVARCGTTKIIEVWAWSVGDIVYIEGTDVRGNSIECGFTLERSVFIDMFDQICQPMRNAFHKEIDEKDKQLRELGRHIEDLRELGRQIEAQQNIIEMYRRLHGTI